MQYLQEFVAETISSAVSPCVFSGFALDLHGKIALNRRKGRTMARKPSVWFRKHDRWYYTTIRGEQIKLSQDKEEADREFHRIMAEQPEEMPRGTRCVKLAQVVKAFLLDSHAK